MSYRDDYYTDTVEDAGRWERDHADDFGDDDGPSVDDLIEDAILAESAPAWSTTPIVCKCEYDHNDPACPFGGCDIPF